MFDNMDAPAKGVLLVVGSYIVSIGVACCIISFAIMTLMETHSCSTMGRALVTLWIIIAVVFLTSGVVVGVVGRKIIPSSAGRLAILIGHGAALLASYVVIAFGLLVAFNC